jgi:hypothetical protein
MNAQHRKTLQALFASSVPRTLEWRRIEMLFVAVGCEMIEGSGSRVAFKRDGLRADFHRPHPGKEAKPYQIRAAREFLEALGVTP